MKKIIYTTGVFDILHRGHINILTQASTLGDLVVGVMTDSGVENAKGKKPILTLAERIDQLRSLPFVHSVVAYADTNQIPQYEKIKPEIVVQGDDWLHSADRTEALAYLKEKNIRLVLLPRTEGISTTEIRKRVQRSSRRDEQFLLDHVRLVPIDSLLLYEEFDEQKVNKLVAKIGTEGVFHNPISIVKENIVIDGNNRLEALRRMAVKWVPVVMYDYNDIDLVGNVHYISGGKRTRLSEFAPEVGEKIEYKKRTPREILEAVQNGTMIPNGETFHRVPHSVIRLPIPLKMLSTGFDMQEFLKKKIEKGAIRFYQSSVYVCDEW
jgi:cytidyltransferase-like protein